MYKNQATYLFAMWKFLRRDYQKALTMAFSHAIIYEPTMIWVWVLRLFVAFLVHVLLVYSNFKNHGSLESLETSNQGILVAQDVNGGGFLKTIMTG